VVVVVVVVVDIVEDVSIEAQVQLDEGLHA
jgi:hypothetical protein